MGEMSRRDLMATGVAGAAVVAGVAACGTASGSTHTAAQDVRLTGPGAPGLPFANSTFRFPLTRTKPQVSTQGGTITECTVQNFPVVGQSDAAVFLLTLQPGDLREPHWHPTASEMDYLVKGTARLGVWTPDGTTDIVDLEAGDVGFVPQGWG